MSDEKVLKSQQNDEAVDQVIDHVKKLPPEKRQQAIAKLEMYSGPIPHPDILDRYNQMDPGAAKQIIDNGVAESEHRRSMESKLLEYSRRDQKRRDWMGFSIGLVIIVVGAFLMYLDHYIVGSILSGGSALGLVGLFLDNGKSSDSDSDNSESEID
ncbi:DUF2335 domain-containing protein [Loigolactobacillus jiayinensis]|uniref:DUF2335 domain-containing protein n=1 Tax=Loigolactobacillus jiayinensis TaxID=2486016 RepID=A0ABW1RHH6_9LACO|nr:DUF2335 domain-containing protein [Loigolactobacillus jiayinensis]